MTRLDEIREYVEREFKNLCKSKNRARSLQGVLTKQELLKDHLIEFETLVKAYEHRHNTEDWNKLTDDLEFVRTRVNQSLKLLNGTSIAPERLENRSRRNSDYCLEMQTPALGQGEPLEQGDSQVWETPQFSSSFNSSRISQIQFPEHIGSREITQEERSCQDHSEEIDLDNTSFIKTLDNLKLKFYKYSGILNKSFSKMANPVPYDFPMVTAVQCIPEFHGKPEELQLFLIQIEYFANGIPVGTPHTPLLNVVYTKLRGEALLRLQDIQDVTWPGMKKKLEETFQPEIETLNQGGTESFDSYKTRAMKLYRYISTMPDHGNDSYVGSTLRKHFLGGLCSRALALTGKSQRDKTFPELLKWLEREYEEVEELRDIHRRLQPGRVDKPRGNNNNNNYNRNNNNYNRNNNNYNRNNNNYNHNNNNNYNHNNNNNYNQNNNIIP
ncbi:uncharacterized protein LOC134288090 [Aedes albopictus]|uniref:DUF4806 domain-containing protein n=1 Tax=Aedes albopictus TaxID=7160 RepID=A0ABM1ZNH3_AEDAL